MIWLGLLAYGVEEVAFINKLFTMVNIVVIIFVTLAGFFVGGDRPFFENWTLNQTEVNDMVAAQFSDNSISTVSCRDINHTNHHAWEDGILTPSPRAVKARIESFWDCVILQIFDMKQKFILYYWFRYPVYLEVYFCRQDADVSNFMIKIFRIKACAVIRLT